MADSKAKPRKTPVRKAPVQKDYPTKLDWLRAMTEYETKQAEATTAAKVARLDKRIESVVDQMQKLEARYDSLIDERAKLTDEVEVEVPDTEPEPEGEALPA